MNDDKPMSRNAKRRAVAQLSSEVQLRLSMLRSFKRVEQHIVAMSAHPMQNEVLERIKAYADEIRVELAHIEERGARLAAEIGARWPSGQMLPS